MSARKRRRKDQSFSAPAISGRTRAKNADITSFSTVQILQDLQETLHEHLPVQLSPERLKGCISKCGACLFHICDDDEDCASEDHEKQPHTFALLDCCRHVFHRLCILTWAKREATCPQCRLYFQWVAWYRLDGIRQEITEITPDMLEEDSDDEEEAERELECGTSRELSDSSLATRQRRRNCGDLPSNQPTSGLEVSYVECSQRSINNNQDLIREDFREQLRHKIEMDRRKRATRGIDASRAQRAIEASLKRMPYNKILQSNKRLPNVPVTRVCAAIKPFSTLIVKNAPKYEHDFLGSK